LNASLVFGLTKLQVLGITCDNASPNNTMIEELPKLIEAFPGSAYHTRCFDHVLALVAKRIVRQFDVTSGGNSDELDEAERELRDLAEGIDIEEETAQRERDTGDDDDDDDKGDEDAEKEMAQLSVADREELDESTRPVRMLLVKVS
jgi:hypothetical protein